MYCPRCNKEVKAIITHVVNTNQTNVRCADCYEIISSRTDSNVE